MTHIFAIIDRSGSMTGLEKATVDGYAEYLKGLRSEKAKVTTVLFDHEYFVHTDQVDVKDAPELNHESYVPRGSTALIDAVCRTINERKGDVKKKDKALVVIITDGQENASREYKTKDMQDLIQGLEKQGNWTFTYLGANQDAWAVAQQFGMQQGNVSTFNATGAGVGQVFSTASANTRAYSMSAAQSTSAFYSAEDKQKLEETK